MRRFSLAEKLERYSLTNKATSFQRTKPLNQMTDRFFFSKQRPPCETHITGGGLIHTACKQVLLARFSNPYFAIKIAYWGL